MKYQDILRDGCGPEPVWLLVADDERPTCLGTALGTGVKHGVVNSVEREEGQRVIALAGLPVHHYCADDAVAEAYAMALLVESGFAQQAEVARAWPIGAHDGVVTGEGEG